MNRCFKCFFALALILSFSLLGLAEAIYTESGQRIVIRIHNLAQAPGGTLTRAIKEANRIFQQAGIEMQWLECGPGMDPILDCQDSPGPTHLALRVVLRSDAQTPESADNFFGLALPYEEGGVRAVVFYQHLQEFAKGGTASLAQVLGHAMAHEIGHLLLWSKSHDESSVMKESWSREDLREIARGHLTFTPQQAEVMKANLMVRLRQEEYLRSSRRLISAGQAVSESIK